MKGRILILEDDHAFAEMLSETLEANDFDSAACLDPTEAIDRVKDEDFDLLITDYLMPKLEGTSYIRKVREFNSTIPVIMISAFMGESEMKQAAEAGVTRVLKKPFEMAELMNEIAVVLESSPARNPSESSEARQTSESAAGYPEPLRFLQAGTTESEHFIRDLWDAYQSRGPIFVTGRRGFEVDLVAAELSAWINPEGGLVSFDFEASELLSSEARSIISGSVGNNDHSKVIIARGLDRLDRSQQRMLNDLMKRKDSYLRLGNDVSYVFAIDSDRLALAEMSMDEDLLTAVFNNLVRIPALSGRYSDIASYLSGDITDERAPSLSLSPEAAATLLHYDWPGNYEELLEVRYRLGKRWGDSVITGEQVRSALEKRLLEPLEVSSDPGLSKVLEEYQNEVIDGILQEERKQPAEILKILGCPEDVSPADRFPQDQRLVFPELLEPVDSV